MDWKMYLLVETCPLGEQLALFSFLPASKSMLEANWCLSVLLSSEEQISRISGKDE
ncbi:MAG: hypothetical protein HQM14_21755 [SAR324 cluster bacterium]|nr:hypothetical protein [SAR324 cluster bacterium]